MIEQKHDGSLIVTPEVSMEQLTQATNNPANKAVEVVNPNRLQERLQALRASRAGKFNRKFARKQWRDSYSSGTFRYRGKLPSCPPFHEIVS